MNALRIWADIYLNLTLKKKHKHELSQEINQTQEGRNYHTTISSRFMKQLRLRWIKPDFILSIYYLRRSVTKAISEIMTPRRRLTNWWSCGHIRLWKSGYPGCLKVRVIFWVAKDSITKCRIISPCAFGYNEFQFSDNLSQGTDCFRRAKLTELKFSKVA